VTGKEKTDATKAVLSAWVADAVSVMRFAEFAGGGAWTMESALVADEKSRKMMEREMTLILNTSGPDGLTPPEGPSQ
jgi:hypothetical protein